MVKRPDRSACQAELERMSSEQPPQYWRALDFARLVEDYPPPPHYFRTVYRMPRDALRELQERRFVAQMARAWQIPFYRRRWGEAGLVEGDIRGIADLVEDPSLHRGGCPRQHRTPSALRRFHGRVPRGRQDDAAGPPDQRRHDRHAAADAVRAAGSRDHGHPRRAPPRDAWRASRGPGPGDARARASQRRLPPARGAVEIYGRRPGHDRNREDHAHPSPDRDHARVGDQRDRRLSRLPPPHGDGGARRDGHRSAQPGACARSIRASDRRIARASRSSGARRCTTSTARTSPA